MKMKVFSCVLLAVLVVGGLAFAQAHSEWGSTFTLGCDWSVTSSGVLNFVATSDAFTASHIGTVYCDGEVLITLKLNCDLSISGTSDENFVGSANGDTMNAIWYGIASYDGTNWFSDVPYYGTSPVFPGDWDSDEGGSGGPTQFSYPSTTCDGEGYLKVKVSVYRNGWSDWADDYTATTTLDIAAYGP